MVDPIRDPTERVYNHESSSGRNSTNLVIPRQTSSPKQGGDGDCRRSVLLAASKVHWLSVNVLLEKGWDAWTRCDLRKQGWQGQIQISSWDTQTWAEASFVHPLGTKPTENKRLPASQKTQGRWRYQTRDFPAHWGALTSGYRQVVFSALSHFIFLPLAMEMLKTVCGILLISKWKAIV